MVYNREMAACVDAGHSASRKSRHSVSAHSAPRHRSKLSTSVLEEELHECQQISLHCGTKEPTTPADAGLDIALENSVQSLTRSLSTKPARQIASVRGRISRLMNSRMEACTAIGGGGGAGGGSTDTPDPPGGGGGAAAPLSQTTESAKRPEQGSMRAYLRKKHGLMEVKVVCVQQRVCV